MPRPCVRSKAVGLCAATTLALAAACVRPAADPTEATGRYRIDVPASGALPAMRLDVSVAPHPAEDLSMSTVTELANPVYLALRTCVERAQIPLGAGALAVSYAPSQPGAATLVPLQGQAPLPAPVVACLESAIATRPEHAALRADATLSVVVVIP